MMTCCDCVLAMSSRVSTLVRRKVSLANPKHQSGANLVCPTGRNESVISVCSPAFTLHSRYCIIYLFLFWPEQLSAWRYASVSPSPWCSKKWWSIDMIELAPLPTLNDSSIRYVICIKINCINFLLSVLNLGEWLTEREAGAIVSPAS